MTTVRSEFQIALKDETRAGIASVNRSLDQLRSKALAVGAGLGAGAGLFAGLVRQSANLADELGKTAQKAGVTVESLSALGYAAKLSDVSTGQLAGSLQRLSRLMAEAAGGSDEAQKAFAAIGVNVTTASGQLRSADDVFTDIAESLSKLPDGAQKTAAAMKLFGRSGAEIIPLLNSGRNGLEEYRKEAERLGLVMSTEAAKAAEEFNDNMTRLNAAMQGFTLNLTGPLIGGLANLSTEFIRAYTEGDGLLRVFDALGSAAARVTFGTDSQRLGELVNEQIGLEKKLAELGPNGASNRGTSALYQKLKAELDDINREIAGLQAVMQPEQFGAAPRTEPPRRTPAQTILQDLGKVSAEAKRVADRLAKESDDVRAYLQDYARDREAMFQREVEQSRSRYAALVDQFATPQEAAMKRLAEIAKVVGPDSATYGRAAVEAFDELNPQIDEADDKAKQLEATFADLGATFNSAFEDAILNGERFSGVLDGLAKDIARLLLRNTVTDPLTSAVQGFFTGGGGSGIGDFFKGLFPNANGGLYRVAGGGGGERPIAMTAQPGEYVSVSRGAPTGGGIVVNVIGAPSTPRVRQSNANGRRQVDLFFVEAAGSAAGQGLLAPLGINPPLVAR